MANYKKYTPWFLLVLAMAYIFLFEGCGGDTKTVYVEVPAKHGKHDTIYLPAPTPAPKKEYVYLAGKDKTDTVKVQNPINQQLWEFYQMHQNKDSLYADAIGEREYNIKQEDSLLITENYIKAQGKVLAFQQSYTIKPQKIAVKDKETFLRLLGGVEVGSNKELNQFTYKANISLQNSKGNTIKASYQRINQQDYVLVGRDWSIFNWRK